MEQKKFQVAIIGSGPGGYVAAVRCAQLGLKTVCIEKRKTLGGTCLNIGCIPSKSLLHSSELFHALKALDEELAPDFTDMMEKKSGSVSMLVNAVAQLLKKYGIERIEGEASFKDSHTLVVNNEEVFADNIIIATGSEPIPLPFAPFDEKKIVSSTGALELEKVPNHLVVIGGGIIGVEIASVYQRLGSKVTIIEMLDQICPGVDLGASKALLQALTKQGMVFHLQSKVTAIQKQDGLLSLQFQKGNEAFNIDADVVLVCVGRRPYTANLGLDKAGVALDPKGRIQVDGSLRTSQKHIYAIGDVIEGPGLAHKASEEGVAVANIIGGKHAHVNYLAIPGVVYTYPEVASVGMTDQQAKDAGLEVIVGQVPMRGNPRARCTGDLDGFVRVIGEKSTGRLIGLHIVSAHASELIAVGMVALIGKMKVSDLADAPFAHPTFSEAIKEASQLALGRAIHA